jgi:hypothetical protein
MKREGPEMKTASRRDRDREGVDWLLTYVGTLSIVPMDTLDNLVTKGANKRITRRYTAIKMYLPWRERIRHMIEMKW